MLAGIGEVRGKGALQGRRAGERADGWMDGYSHHFDWTPVDVSAMPYANYERQMDEMSAVQAIYGDDFEEIRFPWKVEHPPQFKICISVSGRETVSFEILYKLSAGYPREMPQFALINRAGLTPGLAGALKEKMAEYATSILGREMVYDLTELAREHVQSATKVTPVPPSGPKSAHDETAVRGATQLVEPTSSPVGSETPPPPPGDFEERLKSTLAIKEGQAKASRREKQRRGEFQGTILLDQPFYFHNALEDIDSPVTSVTVTRVVETGPALSVYIGKTAHFGQEFCVEEFPISNQVSNNSYAELERLLKPVCALRHPNLSTLFAYKRTDNNSIILIQEYVPGQTLEYIVGKTGGIQPYMALAYLKEVLLGLQYLHANNVVCKCVDLRNVLVENSDKLALKLLHAGFLVDLRVLLGLSTESKFKTKKDDIFACGVLYLKMVFGAERAGDDHKENARLLSAVPEEIGRFVSLFFVCPPSQRPSAGELLDGGIFPQGPPSGPVPPPFYLPKSPSGTDQQAAAAAPVDPARRENATDSRYFKDFDELEFLGKGGFGRVAKARNKLDNQVYAIKVILLDPSNLEQNRKILREVTALSKFHHQHITRYYQAWLEDCDRPTWDSFNIDDEDREWSAATTGRSFERRKGMNRQLLKDIIFNESRSTLDLSSSSEYEYSCSLGESASGDGPAAIDPPATYQLLYIQMEYCPNQTLRDIIDEGTLTADEAWRLLRQMLEALAHIHGQGMIHRDLKPGNIFLDFHGNVKIGDFGLVSDISVEDAETGALARDFSSESRESVTRWIGTPFYTSPEVLTSSGRYNHKVDMYSLGIIFFEMIYPFKTSMERTAVLRKLRDASVEFPADFDTAKLRSQHEIIKNLLSHNPDNRMSSSELLKSPLIPAKNDDQFFNDNVLKYISDPGSLQYHRFVKNVFQDDFLRQHFDIVHDVTFDYNSGFVEGNVDLAGMVDYLKGEFGKFCLAPHNVPLLMPWNPVFESSSLSSSPSSSSGQSRTGPVKLMDSNGNVVVLPFDLAHPLARFVNQNNIVKLKRYQVSHVYRPNMTGGQPRHVLECAVQKISPHPSTENDVYLCRIMCSVLKGLAGSIESTEIHVNHSNVLDGMLDAIRYHYSKEQGLCAVPFMSFLGSSCFGPFTSRLKSSLTVEHALTAKQIDLMSSLSLLKGEYSDRLLPKLDQLLGCRCELGDLKQVVEHLALVGARVIFNPLLYVPHHDGVMYAFGRITPKKKLDILATGGSINGLLDRYRTAKTRRYGSSLSISVPRLNSQWPSDAEHTPPGSATILVSSVKETPLLERMRVAFMLQDAGYACDYTRDGEVYHQTLQQSAGFNVLILLSRSPKIKEGGNYQLRIRHLERKLEVECSIQELLDKLQETLDGTKPAEALELQVHHLMLNPRKSIVHSCQSLVEKATRAVKHLAAEKVQHLIVHDLPRDVYIKASAWTAAEDDVSKRIKGLIKAIQERKGAGLVLFYSVKDDCFDACVVQG